MPIWMHVWTWAKLGLVYITMGKHLNYWYCAITKHEPVLANGATHELTISKITIGYLW